MIMYQNLLRKLSNITFTPCKVYKALQVNVKFIAHVMQLHMLMSVTSLDHFDSAVLRPLRVQTMGSVLVSIFCLAWVPAHAILLQPDYAAVL